MQPLVKGITVIVTAVLLAGCVGHAAETSRTPASSGPITAPEIRAEAHHQALDTYAIVRQLRPHWMLSNRRPIVVYVDGIAWGPPPTRRQVPSEAVREIRYVPVWQSMPYHSDDRDVILVATQ